MRWWTIGWILATGLVGSDEAAAKQFSFHVQRDIPIAGPVQMTLQYHSGAVQIVSSPDSVIRIDATKKVDAVSREEAEEIAGHIEIAFTEKKRSLVVSTNYLRIVSRGESFWEKMIGTVGQSSFGDVDWVIGLPEGSSLELINVTGPVTATDLRSNLTITSSGAAISLERIEGAVTIRNESGVTSLDLIIGTCTLLQPAGTIELQAIEGDVRIKSVSAAISVQQERGALDITTTTGSVDVQTALEDARACLIASESGNVQLTIPRWSSGSLAIESKAGTVRTDVPITIASMSQQRIVGQFGDGGVSVSIRSSTGDVTVAQY